MWESNFHDAPLRLNFNEGVEFSFAAPLTYAAGFFPIFGRSKIGIPKGPGSTLPWPRFVDRTFSSVGVEQQAVTVREFLEASANAHLADIEFFKLVNILDSHGLGQLIDFLLIHPDVARCSGTAVTASGTCKIQTFVIPGLFGQDSVPRNAGPKGNASLDETRRRIVAGASGIPRLLVIRDDCRRLSELERTLFSSVLPVSSPPDPPQRAILTFSV